MTANDSYWINEIRMPLPIVQAIPVDICSLAGISTSHKRSIEIRLWANFGRPSLFDGNVLYSIKTKNDEKENAVADFLSEQVKTFSKEHLSGSKLESVSQRVLQRLGFLIVSLTAQKAGYFRLGGNTLFQMHDGVDKKAYRTVDVQALQEDNFVKIYVVPSMTVLLNIVHTQRPELHDLELVRFCEFRDTCAKRKEEQKCKYSFPDRIGYYEKRNKLQELSERQRDDITTFYSDCPNFPEHGTEVVWVKASRKAKNSKAYPCYLLFTTASDADLRMEDLYDKYRHETLLPSQKRYDQSVIFSKRVFGGENRIVINDLNIPFTSLLDIEGSPHSQTDKVNYPCAILATSPVTSDPNNPKGYYTSGGWQFQQFGSYDRNDTKRPRLFSRIEPYVIAPDKPEIRKLLASLFRCLDTGGYRKKEGSRYGDSEFAGLNTPTSREKYKVEFVAPAADDILYVAPTEQEFVTAAHKIKRDYLAQAKPNYNRIVLIVLHESATPGEDHPLYYKLKKIFVEENIPTQFLTLENLRGLSDPQVPFGQVLWNLFLDLYVKLGGKPWILVNPVSNVNCFVGVGFAVNPRASANHIYAGVANVFDRYGNWLDITSAFEPIKEDQRGDFFDSTALLEGTNSFKISKAVTRKIVSDSLELYRLTQTKQQLYPRNIVFHKLGEIYQCEIEGILEAVASSIGTFQNCRIGIASIHASHNLRLYGSAQTSSYGKAEHTSRVVLRGTRICLLPEKNLLATTGSIRRKDRLQYHGIGTPRPLIVQGITPNASTLRQFNVSTSQSYTTNELTSHIFALTQLHWGSLREDIRYPITVLYAKKVADMISKSETLRFPAPAMSLRRPWFI